MASMRILPVAILASCMLMSCDDESWSEQPGVDACSVALSRCSETCQRSVTFADVPTCGEEFLQCAASDFGAVEERVPGLGLRLADLAQASQPPPLDDPGGAAGGLGGLGPSYDEVCADVFEGLEAFR